MLPKVFQMEILNYISVQMVDLSLLNEFTLKFQIHMDDFEFHFDKVTNILIKPRRFCV